MASTVQSGDNRIILVLGPPGSGKGTVCKKAVELLKRPPHHHLSVGDFLREICEHKTVYDENDIDHGKIRDFLRDNKLLPADVLIPILKREIDHFLCGWVDTWLIDGFPRNMEQLLAFEETIGKPLKVIVLECSSDTAKRRYLSRAREQTNDEERFNKRYGDYIKNIEDIRKHYESTGVMESVPGDGGKEKCLEEFMAALLVASRDYTRRNTRK
ncbi:P-loop containing nucleoside triphosphate hydrolase protein [Xylaria arbuscula]|nr:P-loop containing nucleoside triphosphate hydrolase protein [Xylaria arbuscula]